MKPPAHLERLIRWRYAGQAGIAWHRGKQRFVLLHRAGRGRATRVKVTQVIEGPRGEFRHPNVYNTLGWLADPSHDTAGNTNRWRKAAWKNARRATKLVAVAAEQRKFSERNRLELAPRLKHAMRRDRRFA